MKGNLPGAKAINTDPVKGKQVSRTEKINEIRY